MQVRELLDQHAQAVCRIAYDKTVEDAIEEMKVKQIGALIVEADGIPVGLFAERDVLRCYVNGQGKPFSEIKIKDAMTNKLIVVQPNDEISAATAMMLKADIRHLPVVEDKQIIAMLTINALVGHQISTLTEELQYLHEYLADLQDARKD
jgi:CBS domain-containing protein